MMLRFLPRARLLLVAGDASFAADEFASRWRANIFLSCCGRQISFSVYLWGKAKVSAPIKEREQPTERERRRQGSAPEPTTAILRCRLNFLRPSISSFLSRHLLLLLHTSSISSKDASREGARERDPRDLHLVQPHCQIPDRHQTPKEEYLAFVHGSTWMARDRTMRILRARSCIRSHQRLAR